MRRIISCLVLVISLISTSGLVAQVTANQPSDIALCDDDNDGFAVFDLTITEPEIIGGQDPTDLVVSYYVSLVDADSNMNVIVTPNSFFNTINPQTIYARLENSTSGEFDVTNFNLMVYLSPETVAVSDLIGVDEDGDGLTNFDLTSKLPEILNGQTADVTFFESIQDANSNVNIIANPISYINTMNPQTIYARLESLETSCFAVGEFDLVTVEALIDTEPDDITIDEGDDDGIAIFDLTTNESQILGDQDPLIFLFSYHISQDDAINGVNNIETPDAYENVVNPQTIYVRLTNSNTDFYVLTDFKIITDGNLNIEDQFLSSLKLYPNPTTKIVNLNFNNSVEQIKVTIYSFLGQELNNYERQLNNDTVSIDISELNAGIYFIKIASGKYSTIKKLVKN